VLDNATGDVLAYVGSSGDLSDAGEVDAAAALRQPGSTLKPFLYAVAIGERWLTAASVLDDSPLALTTPGGLYIPQNYDRDHKGPVTVRTALASSLNVPAVRTLTLVGLERFHDRLRALGFTSLTRDAEHYGYGLALGGAETSLVAMANAYRALANAGRVGSVRYRPDAPVGDLRPALDPAASYVIADILADEGARALTFGLASPLATRSWAAVKTGTSKGMRDNWAVGFTDRYTVAVWVGNASGAPMWDVSGITGAAPVWRAIVEYLHADSPSRAPTPPGNVVRTSVAFAPAIEPPRNEWFVAGTEQKVVALPVAEVRPRIVAPSDGAVIAPDPDIPAARQRILVQAQGAGRGCVSLDDVSLGCGDAPRLIALPQPGRHRVQLTSAEGERLAEATFDVRALPLPRRAGASDQTATSTVATGARVSAR
jgi:penicillin-binding protein 1C